MHSLRADSELRRLIELRSTYWYADSEFETDCDSISDTLTLTLIWNWLWSETRCAQWRRLTQWCWVRCRKRLTSKWSLKLSSIDSTVEIIAKWSTKGLRRTQMQKHSMSLTYSMIPDSEESRLSTVLCDSVMQTHLLKWIHLLTTRVWFRLWFRHWRTLWRWFGIRYRLWFTKSLRHSSNMIHRLDTDCDSETEALSDADSELDTELWFWDWFTWRWFWIRYRCDSETEAPSDADSELDTLIVILSWTEHWLTLS